MYTETDGSRKAIGDVDVLFHDGLYHLFHLVLPNHDFIAHAVSTDGIHWRRVRNALFIGDPGSWDDLMLWTMHISPDPHREGCWRMFYTGLTRRDKGLIQRIGLARSEDLYHWEKFPVSWKDLRGLNDPPKVKEARAKSCRTEPDDTTAVVEEGSCFPLEADAEFYESSLEEGRHWVSLRDPYFFVDGDRACLLAAARVKDGPIVRRGAVGLFEETAPNCFSARAALHHPGLYDDIEVPNFIRIEEQDYLIGSIREDAKIRYWYGDGIRSHWRSHHDNVLMPQGNYAGRVCRDQHGWLLWCFFAMNRQDRTDNNLMPPPKRLARDADGLLYVKTYEEFQHWCEEPAKVHSLSTLRVEEEGCRCIATNDRWEVESPNGFQAFVLEEAYENFWLRCRLNLRGRGKCGLVFRVDPESHDGYYLSLDLLKGVAQLRAWGTNNDAEGEAMMCFETLQSGYWYSRSRGDEKISLLTFGSYLELSIGGRIVLSLADQQFKKGRLGVYLETAELTVSDVELCPLRRTEQADDHLIGG